MSLLVSLLDDPTHPAVDTVLVAGGRGAVSEFLAEERFGCLSGALFHKSGYFRRVLQEAEAGTQPSHKPTSSRLRPQQVIAVPFVEPEQLRAILTWAWTGELDSVWAYVKQRFDSHAHESSSSKLQRDVLQLDAFDQLLQAARQLQFDDFETEVIGSLDKQPKLWMLRALLLKVRFGIDLPQWCPNARAVFDRVVRVLSSLDSPDGFYKLATPLGETTHSTVALLCALYSGVNTALNSGLSGSGIVAATATATSSQPRRVRVGSVGYDRGSFDDPRCIIIPRRMQMRRELQLCVPAFVKRVCINATGQLADAFKTWYFRGELYPVANDPDPRPEYASDCTESGVAPDEQDDLLANYEAVYHLGFGLPSFEAAVKISRGGKVDFLCALVEPDNEEDKEEQEEDEEQDGSDSEGGRDLCDETVPGLVEMGHAQIAVSLWLQAHRIAQVVIRKNTDPHDSNLLEIVNPNTWGKPSAGMVSPRAMKVAAAAAQFVDSPFDPKPCCWITWSLMLVDKPRQRKKRSLRAGGSPRAHQEH